jgi:hypothetical protein
MLIRFLKTFFRLLRLDARAGNRGVASAPETLLACLGRATRRFLATTVADLCARVSADLAVRLCGSRSSAPAQEASVRFAMAEAP